MKEKFLKAMQFRHACKLFDTDKEIPEEDRDYILETGRLSPSSFGFEHWRFLIVKDHETKQKLQKLCYDQPQVGTASFIVVTLAIKGAFLDPDGEYVDKMLKRLGPDMHGYLLDFYKEYHKAIDTAVWSKSQCYIAASNMMTAAAFIGIDSCPMEGFDPEGVKDLLNIDREKYEVAIIVPYGYRAKDQPGKHRLPIEEIVIGEAKA